MPQVSDYPLKKEVYKQIFGLLSRVITDSFSQDEANKLLENLLTPTERIVLAKRLAIALLIEKGYSYDEIKNVLRVSKPTISTVKMVLRYEGQGYRSFIQRILKEQQTRKVWEKIEDLVLNVGSLPTRGSSGWRYLRREIKKARRKDNTPISG